MGKIEELLELARRVPGTYGDFVFSVKSHIDDYPGNVDAIIDFIKGDPMRDSSDVLGFLWQLEGLSFAPLEIVDDEDDSEWDIAQERIA